jgi:drug/metabolite transporter (DMT)-like permease
LPPINWQSWAIIAWLAVVNTAFAFTLWNVSLRTLSAMESSIINNTMAVQIPILAVVFLGERLNGRQIWGLIIAVVGTLLVQLGRKRLARYGAVVDKIEE